MRCYVSYALSFFGSVHIAHSPLFVSVEPASICQLRCPECPVGQRGGKSLGKADEHMMSSELWQRTLSEITPYAHTVQFYFQGEPLLNTNLPQMIAQASREGLYTVLSTNAQALTPALAEALVRSGLRRIIVSMDGLTDETYNAYRVGGSLQKTKAAIRSLRAAKELYRSRMIIELQCLRLRSNEHEWTDFKRSYSSMGADRLVFKTAQLYDYSSGHPLMPSNPRYSRYIKGTDGLYHRRPLSSRCQRVWSGVVITTTGEVLPCCYDKNHTFSYGNIMHSSISELFSGARSLAFRKAVLNQTPEICRECYK